MVKKSTWVIIIIFVVLVVGMLLINKYPVGPFKGTPTSTSLPFVIESIDFTSVTNIEIISESGSFQLSKGAGTWELLDKQKTPVSQEKIDELFFVLENLDSKASMDRETPLDAMGLTMPIQTINLKTDSGAEYTINIGAATPTGSGFYAQANGGIPQIISSFAGTSLARFSDPGFIVLITPEP